MDTISKNTLEEQDVTLLEEGISNEEELETSACFAQCGCNAKW